MKKRIISLMLTIAMFVGLLYNSQIISDNVIWADEEGVIQAVSDVTDKLAAEYDELENNSYPLGEDVGCYSKNDYDNYVDYLAGVEEALENGTITDDNSSAIIANIDTAKSKFLQSVKQESSDGIKYNVYRDFENDKEGEYLPYGMVAKAITNGGKATIVSEYGNSFLRLTTGTASGKVNFVYPYWSNVVTSGKQRVICEFSVRFNEELRYANILFSQNQDGDSATTIAFENANKQHKVVLKKSASSISKVADFVYNKWHDFIVVINIENKVYDVYMDGIKIATDYPFRGTTNETTMLTAQAFGIDGFANGKVDFDNIKTWVVDEYIETDKTNATVKADVNGIIAAKLNGDELLADTSVGTYSMWVKSPLDYPVSLDSKGIILNDSQGTEIKQKITDNLYYSSQTGVANNTYTQYTKVDYITITKTGDEETVINYYDANNNKLSGGKIFIILEEENQRATSIDMHVVRITTKNEEVVSTELMSMEPFSYVCNGVVGDIFDLGELTGYTEFYYGNDLNQLTKCTKLIMSEENGKAILYPIDDNGNAVNASVYIVYDHLYSFDVTINNIVNEHSEDNGDVYLWRGNQVCITSNLTPSSTDSIETIDAEKTKLQPYTIAVTGRIGDSFEVSEFNELLIYAAIGEKQEFITDWCNLQKHPSDNGARYYSGYCINDYLLLNSFKDKVNYFVIQEGANGEGELNITIPGNQTYSIDEADFYTTRGCLIKQTVKQHRDLYHVQLRVPSNVVVENDGELYSGEFTLKGGSTRVLYKGELLVDKAFSNISTNGSQQESNAIGWDKDYIFAYDEEGNLVEESFDASNMEVSVTYMLYGTLTSDSGKQLVYTVDEPFVATETMTTEKLYQSFYACPNQRGFDVMLDISAAVKNSVNSSGYDSSLTLTKIWDDGQDYYGIRPNSVTLTLERSDDDGATWSEFSDNVFVMSGTGENEGKSIWTKEITDIDTYITNSEGEIIPYKFRIKTEEYTDNTGLYKSIIDGTIVTNSLDLQTEKNISIQKKWQDFYGEAIYEGIPLNVNFNIYQDGKYYCTGTVYARNGWLAEELSLPVYDENMNKHVYTCCELDANGSVIANGAMMLIDDKHYEYSESDVNDSNQSNAFVLTNTYKQKKFVTISNDVLKTFIETYDFTDKSAEFGYTLTLKNNDTKVEAFSYSDNVEFLQDSMQYRFDLSTQEDVRVEVLQGVTVSVEQSKNGKYATSWKIEEGDWTDGYTAVVDSVIENTEVSFKNVTTYYGDVEVQGFQMNTNYSEGGVSEHSPSFRVVLRACDKLKNSKGELRNVVAYGTIFALDSEVNSDYVKYMKLDSAIKADSDYVYTGDEFKKIYYYECIDGDYFDWTAREVEDPYYNYFALTFVMKSYSYITLKQPMTFRAYAKLDDGSIVYGTKVYSTRMYDIAENLYKNRKVGTKESHEYLYRNVLNLVKMEENRVDICYSMLNALKVASTSDIRYTMINNVSKDIVDYVYCQGEYSYSDRQTIDKEFVPKRLSNQELNTLLQELNSATITNHESLYEWIYSETEKINNYKGLYKIINYDWDSSIYDDATSIR